MTDLFANMPLSPANLNEEIRCILREIRTRKRGYDIPLLIFLLSPFLFSLSN